MLRRIKNFAMQQNTRSEIKGRRMDDVRLNDGLEGYFVDELSVGMTAAFSKTITEADIVLFAGVSGDMNPIHVNDAYAKGTRFKGRIAHGFLAGSLISSCLAMKLPGPGCIYVKQSMDFRAPVRPGDTVEARVTVLEIEPESRRVTLKTVASVGETVVIEGQAVLMVPKRR
jgi:3-hydroxybutyryl-CoA dehydratase